MEVRGNYFSWSRYSLWNSSKLQFYKRYVLGEESPRLPQFEKGNEFGQYRETGEIPHYVDDPLLETVSNLIPKLDLCEAEIRCKFDDITLLAYLDETKSDFTHFSEFKTGRIPWDQQMVMEHKQLDFYATCIYILSNETTIPTCTLYWVETEEYDDINGDKQLRYTGHVESFDRSFEEKDIINMAQSIYTTWNEIKNYVHEEVELEEDLVDRYIDLLQQKKEIDGELDLIKLKVLDTLTSVNSTYGVSSRGRFSISKRKLPKYSAELLIEEKKLKDKIAEMKRKEKSSPNMQYDYTESLRFNLIK
jgi:hypothetical protein